MLLKIIKKIFFGNKETKENFDKLYKADQNIKSENYIIEKKPIIKQLKKR